jgi:hypothetical protein
MGWWRRALLFATIAALEVDTCLPGPDEGDVDPDAGRTTVSSRPGSWRRSCDWQKTLDWYEDGAFHLCAYCKDFAGLYTWSCYRAPDRCRGELINCNGVLACDRPCPGMAATSP